MTKNKRTKDAARQHAAATGVSYTQALREVTSGTAADRLEPFAETILLLQPGLREDGVLPYPWQVNVTLGGLVEHQNIWRGEPLRLAGFARKGTPYHLILTETEAFADPDSIVGLAAVYREFGGGMGTYSTIEDVKKETVTGDDPEAVTLTVTDPFTETSATIRVGHVLRFVWKQLLGPDRSQIANDGGYLLLRAARAAAPSLPEGHREHDALDAAEKIESMFEEEFDRGGFDKDGSEPALEFTLHHMDDSHRS